MSTQTSSKLALVPEEIKKNYLKGYSPAELKKIEDIYKEVSQQAFEGKIASEENSPTVVLIVGAQGSGKSTLGRNIRQRSSESFVNADVDRIMKMIPDVAQDLRAIAQAAHSEADFGGYNPRAHFNDAETTIKKWRPAAEYMRDKLLTDALENGFSVMMQASGKSAGIVKLINSLKENGFKVDTHICVAPVSVAIHGANTPEHGFAYAKDVIRADHMAMRENIPAIMEEARKSAKLYYRGYINSDSEMVLAVFDEKIIVGNGQKSYDAHVADLPYAISVQNIRHKLEANALGTEPTFSK